MSLSRAWPLPPLSVTDAREPGQAPLIMIEKSLQEGLARHERI